MLREIARACEDASWDDDIRVVVVTGTGRAFCVGADLRSWDEDLLGQPSEYWKWFGAFKDMHDRLREIGKPTIARVNGIAVGGGNELQMACDLVGDGRHRVHPPRRPAARLGARGRRDAVAAAAWSAIAARARSSSCATRSPAAQAEEWGLVNRVGPGGRARRVPSTSGSRSSRARLPQTTRYAKQQLNVWRDLAWHQTVGHARDWLAMSMLGEEAQDAVRAFLDRDRKD